jgi:hypothetical protein
MLKDVSVSLPEVRAGKVPFTVRNNRRVYRFSGFSFSLANPD